MLEKLHCKFQIGIREKNGPVDSQEISVHCQFIMTMGVSEFSTLDIYKLVVWFNKSMHMVDTAKL